MIASDLDGTLLYELEAASPENYAAIADYAAMGGTVVPTTGRCLYEIPEELRKCPDIRYIISSGGAAITDLKTGENDSLSISPACFAEVVKILGNYACFLSFHHAGYGYMNIEQDDESVIEDFCVHPYYFMHYHATCQKVDYKTFLQGLSPDMFSVFFRHDSELAECKKCLETLGGLTITSSAPHNIEVVAEGVSKGATIRRLAKKLNIDISHVIGIGDSENDLSMLEAVGLPLAVSNACKPLKEKAEKVICSNKEHIMRYILDNIIA